MVTGLNDWKRAFPNGCPYDKLPYFIVEQTNINDRIRPDHLLIDSKGGPVLEWDKLIERLQNLKQITNINLVHELQNRFNSRHQRKDYEREMEKSEASPTRWEDASERLKSVGKDVLTTGKSVGKDVFTTGKSVGSRVLTTMKSVGRKSRKASPD